MKAITYMLAGALAVFAGTNLWAIPAGFNVQGRLTDTDGINKDGTFQIKFSIFAADTGGSPVWEKNMPAVIVKNGNFQIILQGQGDNSIQLETALKDLEAAYVEIKVGNEPPLVPRQPLLRSPLTSLNLYSAHTAGRPASPSIGTIIFNTDLNRPEYYDGTKWMAFMVAASDLSITGGLKENVGDYTVHKFLSGTQNLVVTGSGVVNYFILGGGGGGGPVEGGGGGGGGKLMGTRTLSAGTYPITVGGATPAYTKGNDSSAFGLTAIGGGRGGSGGGGAGGGSGGSGGGGGSTSGPGGAGTPGQGYNGGSAQQYSSTGGGGGGAGGSPVGPFYIDGGIGYTLPFNGVTYGGGGGGGNGQGQPYYGVGGAGGGGSGGLNGPGLPGTNGLGGGGGGGGNTGQYTFGGGAGGSGIVIIWYLTP